ncbi:hypothetical protein [Bradyrhizobium sp. AZCC 2289]|uniref:hypothetical protein n=1 Tax=Bradyrhizobium sp. AZCC 2289 TaxID=3117026 RepID=UPI002FEF5495
MAHEFTAEKLAKMDAAVDDDRLTDLDVRLFWKMASAADSATRVVRRKQSTFAAALAVSRRAIQLSMDRLSAYGYVAPLTNKASGSRTYVNAFEIAPKANLCSHYTSEPTFVFRKKKRTAVQEDANLGSKTSEPRFAHDPLSSLGIPKRISKIGKGKVTVKCESPSGKRWQRYCSENGIPEPVRSARTDSYIMLPSEEPPARAVENAA